MFVVRKLGVPGQEELALGAIATGGTRVLNRQVVDSLAIPPELVEAVDAREMQELQRRERDYRGDRPAPGSGCSSCTSTPSMSINQERRPSRGTAA